MSATIDPFERFSEDARRVLARAREQAETFQHGYVGSEHLLLGMLADESGLAGRFLRDSGLTLQQARGAVEFVVGQGEHSSNSPIELSPRAALVCQNAVSEAARSGAERVGSEHLLLALLTLDDSIAVGVIESVGFSAEALRTTLLKRIAKEAVSTPAPAAPPSRTPILDTLGVDLTARAKARQLDPMIGRASELERVIQVLSRRTKNNAVLVGEPGVGKTAIAEGLAARIAASDVPATLLDRRVVTLEVGSLMANTKFRGELEERLKKVIDEVRAAGNIILVLDEIHTLVGAGAGGGGPDAASFVKPPLARGELHCLGMTTLDEFRTHIERDPALERRFQMVLVEEPTPDAALEMLQGLRSRYESYHHVSIPDTSLRAAVDLSARYITERFLPDKAIDVMDEAASRVRLATIPKAEPPRTSAELEAAYAALHPGERAPHSAGEDAPEARRRLEMLRRPAGPKVAPPEVTVADIAAVVSMWTGVPVQRVAANEAERLLHLEAELHQRVVGQDEAVRAVAQAMRRARSGLKDPKRPIGVFFLVGPTGTGKTLLARALAGALFGSEEHMVKIDMSDYMERHNVSRLVGAPPGYVGHEDAGLLTERVRRQPYTVVLLDEIEKAHPQVFDLLLQLFDTGRITDSRGRQVDFRNTVILMTSNVGQRMMKSTGPLGFRGDASGEAAAAQRASVESEMRQLFRPEFLNRIDATLFFSALGREQVRRIVGIEMERVRARLAPHGVGLELSEAALDLLAERGYDPLFGARPLTRVIQDLVEDPLSEMLLRGDVRSGDVVEDAPGLRTLVLRRRGAASPEAREAEPLAA